MKYLLFITLATASLFAAGQSILASHEFEADNITSITLEGKFCDVFVKKGPKVMFNGVIEGSGDPEDYEITSDIRGSNLYIRVEKYSRGWDRMIRSDLKLEVPENVLLNIENSSGDIDVTGISGERIVIEATSGDIDIRGIEGRLQVGSTSGDLEIRQVRGSIIAKSTSGSQEYEEIVGDLETVSTSGDIDIDNYDGNVRAEATSGSIRLERGVGEMYLRTTSGDIDGYYVVLKGDAEFRASSGDVEIELANRLDEFSFDLQTSSGSLRVGSRSSEKNLYMKQGGYWIRGVTSSGDIRVTD